MLKFLVDFFKYPFSPSDPHNKFRYVLQFVFKDYPVYMRVKPKRWKFFLFPFLVVYKIFMPMKG